MIREQEMISRWNEPCIKEMENDEEPTENVWYIQNENNYN